jgi:glycosyltransferase involved in cell wall biosynthesis
MKLLWIPHAGWHIPQRAHLFCRALAERHEVHVTDWVTDFRTPRDLFSKRYLQNFFYRQYRDVKILVHGVPRFSPALFSPTLRDINRQLFERTIARIISKYKIDVVVGTFVVPPPHAPRLIFDLFDDNVSLWRRYGRNTAYAEEIQSTEKAYFNQADTVIAASTVLIDLARKNKARGPVHWLPNGVEIDRFDPPSIETHRPVVVGLIGNHDQSEELNKVISAAKDLPQFKFRIAGRGSAIPDARLHASKLGLNNISFDGPIELDEIPNWMHTLDIGLCPYQKTLADDARSSIRLLQYSAAGLPVVCTNLEEVRRMNFSNVVLVQDGIQALAEGILSAVNLPKERPPQLVKYDLPRLVARLESILCGDAI